jgi:hypothetical protein
MSKKAHNGSGTGSSSHNTNSHPHMHANSQTSHESLVERYLKDQGDYRSLAVPEFDGWQEAVKKRRIEELREILGKKYWQ